MPNDAMMKWIAICAFALLGFWEPSLWLAVPLFFNGCDNCKCDECACTDDYSIPGTGGAGRPCPFTGGDDLVIADGVLNGLQGRSIVFTHGPDDDTTSTIIFTVIVKSVLTSGPSVIRLRVAIDGGNYVYGQLTVSGSGDVTISVGTNAGELANEDAGAGGISSFVTLELCFDPPADGEDGRLNFRYVKGGVTHCLRVVITTPGGGGFPGLDFTTDDWKVDRVSIACSESGCVPCGDVYSCDTDDCCTDSGDNNFREEMLADGFIDEGGCPKSVESYLMAAAGSPPGLGATGCYWLFETSCSGGLITKSVFMFLRREGDDCFWYLVFLSGINPRLLSFNPPSSTFTTPGYYVSYKSGAIADGDCDDWPITLNKLEEIQNLGSGGGFTAATFPDSITVDPP